MKNKVVVIGCGNVGMSYCYALLNQKVSVRELVLIDINKDRVEGEVMDLCHSLAFAPSNINIKMGEYSDCNDATLVVIAAGANQSPGETRMDLINKNSKIFKSIVTEVVDSGFNGIFLVATNPLDVMTYLTWKYSGFDTSKVMGTGTSLDSARLKFLLGEKIGISPKNIHAYVIGEHGDSEFVPWTTATVGLQDMSSFITDDDKNSIEHEVRNAAYEVINKKGATYYGIGMALAMITNAILNDENRVITVSNYDKNNEIFVGTPAVVNKDGVKQKIYIDLSKEEEEKLQNSINIIKDAIKSLED